MGSIGSQCGRGWRCRTARTGEGRPSATAARERRPALAQRGTDPTVSGGFLELGLEALDLLLDHRLGQVWDDLPRDLADDLLGDLGDDALRDLLEHVYRHAPPRPLGPTYARRLPRRDGGRQVGE